MIVFVLVLQQLVLVVQCRLLYPHCNDWEHVVITADLQSLVCDIS